MKLSESVFRVHSSDRKNTKFGTCFIIHKDTTSTYFLTCAHVIEDIGGENSIQIDKQSAELIAKNHYSHPDLAVLKVNKLFSQPPLPLGDYSENEKKFELYGYRKIHKINKRYAGETVNGLFGKMLDLSVEDTVEKYEGRKLNIDSEGDGVLVEGNSGSPVYDLNNEMVMGVATDKLKEGKKGIAISIKALSAIWPDAPKKLFRLEITKGPIRKYLCDRKDQDDAFQDLFKQALNEKPYQPQFYFMLGKQDANHESLVERFKALYVNKNLKNKGTTLHIKMVIQGLEKDLERFRENFINTLVGKLNGDDLSENGSIQAICTDLNLSCYSAVIISHEIYGSEWNVSYRKLLSWYIRDFFKKNDWNEKFPLFLVFFNIHLPEKGDDFNALSWMVWRYFKRKQLNRYLKKNCAQYGCTLLKELEDIKKTECKAWLKLYETEIDEEIRFNAIKSLYRDRQRVSMLRVESCLKGLL